MKDTLLIVLKFVLALLLLPVVIATTHAFYNELSTFDPVLRQALWTGMVSYVLMRFFVYDFAQVYVFGQNIVTTVFQFLKPLVNAAPYVLPIYTILLCIVYAIVMLMGKMGQWQPVFVFLFAFTFSMHIILTAADLYNKDSIAGKPNYFFAMALVYIIDVFFMALLMNATVQGFSFIHFFQELGNGSVHIYKVVFHQLF